MGRIKRDMSYLLPFCYYCDKTFKNEIVLHQHQKAKHFTCQKCQKKFSTADAMKQHTSQTHKESVNKYLHFFFFIFLPTDFVTSYASPLGLGEELLGRLKK